MSDYWEERALESLTRQELITDGYAKKLLRIYAGAYDELESQLNKLFLKYITDNGITPTQAAKYLREPISGKEAAALREIIDGIKDPKVQSNMIARINSSQTKARMTRIRAAQESIRAVCAESAEKEIALHLEAARANGVQAYYHTIFDDAKGKGVTAPFTDIRIEQIDAVLSERWLGKNYSDRVWDNTDVLAEKLGEIVQVNVATGRSWKRCLSDIRQYMVGSTDAGYMYAASRLLFTEQQRVNNRVSAQACMGLGYERYRFIAVLDLKTSGMCRAHDGLIDPDTGKPYTYANEKDGTNFPPLHPWCRSVTAPVVDEHTLDGLVRPATDPVYGGTMKIPASMTYQEWHAKYVEGDPDAEFNDHKPR